MFSLVPLEIKVKITKVKFLKIELFFVLVLTGNYCYIYTDGDIECVAGVGDSGPGVVLLPGLSADQRVLAHRGVQDNAGRESPPSQ